MSIVSTATKVKEDGTEKNIVLVNRRSFLTIEKTILVGWWSHKTNYKRRSTEGMVMKSKYWVSSSFSPDVHLLKRGKRWYHGWMG